MITHTNKQTKVREMKKICWNVCLSECPTMDLSFPTFNSRLVCFVLINCSNLLQNFATPYSCHPNHCGLCSKPNNAISWGIPKAQMSFVCVALLCFDLLACAKTSVLCGNGRTKLQADFVTQSFSKWSRCFSSTSFGIPFCLPIQF